MYLSVSHNGTCKTGQGLWLTLQVDPGRERDDGTESRRAGKSGREW